MVSYNMRQEYNNAANGHQQELTFPKKRSNPAGAENYDRPPSGKTYFKTYNSIECPDSYIDLIHRHFNELYKISQNT